MNQSDLYFLIHSFLVHLYLLCAAVSVCFMFLSCLFYRAASAFSKAARMYGYSLGLRRGCLAIFFLNVGVGAGLEKRCHGLCIAKIDGCGIERRQPKRSTAFTSAPATMRVAVSNTFRLEPFYGALKLISKKKDLVRSCFPVTHVPRLLHSVQRLAKARRAPSRSILPSLQERNSLRGVLWL